MLIKKSYIAFKTAPPCWLMTQRVEWLLFNSLSKKYKLSSTCCEPIRLPSLAQLIRSAYVCFPHLGWRFRVLIINYWEMLKSMENRIICNWHRRSPDPPRRKLCVQQLPGWKWFKPDSVSLSRIIMELDIPLNWLLGRKYLMKTHALALLYKRTDDYINKSERLDVRLFILNRIISHLN